jgi:predicted nucleic acid-binding Zn ribbon protein
VLRDPVAAPIGKRYPTRMAVPARRKYPQQIGGPLQEILARLDTEGHFEIVRLMRLWPDAVGETIARRTQVAGLKFHVATVKVSGAMWIQELNLMKPQILSRLNDALGNDTVRDIRFVQGRLSRRERPRLRTVPRATRHAIELPELKDPELRRAFESLIEAWGRASR